MSIPELLLGGFRHRLRSVGQPCLLSAGSLEFTEHLLCAEQCAEYWVCTPGFAVVVLDAVLNLGGLHRCRAVVKSGGTEVRKREGRS